MTTPSLRQVAANAVAAAMRGFYTSLPARVASYDESTHQITAIPLVSGFYVDESGERVAEALPPIANVPVMFPGAGPFRMTWPINPGDVVMLLFTSCSMDLAIARNAVNNLGDELDDPLTRRNDLNDAVAIPWPFEDRGIAEGPLFEITASQIRLGGGNRLATLDDLNSLRTFVAANAAHSHAAPGGATSPAVPVGDVSTPYAGTSTLRGG